MDDKESIIKFKSSLLLVTPNEDEDSDLTEPQREDTFQYINEIVKLSETNESDSFALLDEINPLHLPKPYTLLPHSFNAEKAPKSYTCNSDKEDKCLEYINNFARQYKLLFKDRKQLFLAPENEFNVKKFICTFLRPTKLPFPELYTWQSISSFVCDYLTFVPVVPSTEFPKRVISSTTLLEIEMGTSFEFANLLCSLLLGVGYDAYCVTGYATRECCYVDQSRSNCPFLEEPSAEVEERENIEISKYVVRSAKDLKSKYELYNEAKKIQDNEIEKKKKEKELELEERIKQKPLPDPLSGLRVHCWILVKKPLRDVSEDFFIEPLTGLSVILKTEMYLGIESIYNDQNCWLNMQDCSKGIGHMKYNLDDLRKWEFVLPTNLKYQNAKVVNLSDSLNYSDEGIPGQTIKNKGLLNLIECPSSWVQRIGIKFSDFERRFPNNHKTTIYYKVKCEQFSPYSKKNGLILRLTLYTDRSLVEVTEEQEYYGNKSDKLFKVVKKDGWTKEYFHDGRSHQLREHHFKTNLPDFEAPRILVFNYLRVDGLLRREESPSSLNEYYSNRKDHLIFMCCEFFERVIKFEEETDIYRNIKRITKRFDRNPEVPFSEDIKEIVFYVSEDRIVITYHLDTFGLIPNVREFIKPPMSQDGKNTIPFYADTHTLFQANPIGKKKETKLEVYKYLLNVIEEERKTKDMIRWSELETKNILSIRKSERTNFDLGVTLYDCLRNDVARAKRIELELIDEVERNKRTEDELDYLAPFLAQMSINEIDTQEEAFAVREECLQDFKLRLIENANNIQLRYEDETSLLQQNQQWYHQNQSVLTKEDEKNYLIACTNSTLKINTLEAMLAKHKHVAPQKYMSLEKKIRNDPRIKPFLSNF